MKNFQNGDLLCPTYDCKENTNKLFLYIMLDWDEASYLGYCKIYNIQERKISIISGRTVFNVLKKAKT
jgi:hypothetical protein